MEGKKGNRYTISRDQRRGRVPDFFPSAKKNDRGRGGGRRRLTVTLEKVAFPTIAPGKKKKDLLSAEEGCFSES